MRSLRIHSLLKQDPSAEERRRIEALLQNYYRFIRDQFKLFLTSAKDPVALAQVEQAIEEGRVLDAYNIVDSWVVRFANTVVSQIPNIGRQEAEALASQAGLAGSGIAVSFNPTAPEVIAAMNRNRLEFIRDFTQDQRLAVNQALTQAMREGWGTVDVARAFRDTVGLTSYQQGMVDNYRHLLETNNARALDLILRDRRYDAGFESAIDGDYVLSQSRIDTMVDRYRDRLLQLRAETIARTESGRVAEETRHISVLQVADRAGTSHEAVVKQWMATSDSRTRDTHADLHGQARLLDDPFESSSGALLMYPHDRDAPAAEVINCRCTVAHHIFATVEEAYEFVRENGQGKYE